MTDLEFLEKYFSDNQEECQAALDKAGGILSDDDKEYILFDARYIHKTISDSEFHQALEGVLAGVY